MLLRRIVLLYIVLLLCRIVFYCYNYALIGPLGWQEVLTLAGGGLKFDTVSIIGKTKCDGIQNQMRLFGGRVSPKRKATKISHTHTKKHRSNGF